MSESTDRMVVEVDFRDARVAYEAFIEWAGRDAISVFFEPEPIMAVDCGGHRGYLYDETYFITIWLDVGGNDFLALLRRHEAAFDIKLSGAEPDPESILSLVLEQGIPLNQVASHRS